MTNRKATTMDLQGKEYARVPERLKLFREDCPRGSIKTDYKFLESGQVVYTAYINKDKKDPSAGDATGHSLGGVKGTKDFEKLETIAVGRALALLGYLASGEIASSEEMEEFNAYKEEQHKKLVNLALGGIESASTIEELRELFVGLGSLIADEKVIAAKDKRKEELTNPGAKSAKRIAKPKELSNANS